MKATGLPVETCRLGNVLSAAKPDTGGGKLSLTRWRAGIPELTRIADYFEKDEKDFTKNLMLVKAKSVRETTHAIEASTDTSELIRLN